MSDVCVVCGDYVPEGVWVCFACRQRRVDELKDWLSERYKKYLKERGEEEWLKEECSQNQ